MVKFPAMAVPASKLNAYQEEMRDTTRILSGPRASYILGDLRRMLHGRISTEDAGAVHNLIGLVHMHLSKIETALEHFRQAVSLTPHKSVYRSNLGSSLVMMGAEEEGLDMLISATECQDGYTSQSLANVAIALFDTGRVDEAHEVMREAARLSDGTEDAKTLLALASGAALVGLDGMALKALARHLARAQGGALQDGDEEAFLRALTHIPDHVSGYPELQNALVRLRKFGPALTHLRKSLPSSRGSAPAPQANEEAEQVFLAMSPLRKQATAASLEHDNGR